MKTLLTIAFVGLLGLLTTIPLHAYETVVAMIVSPPLVFANCW
jgi:hypothetical protein